MPDIEPRLQGFFDNGPWYTEMVGLSWAIRHAACPGSLFELETYWPDAVRRCDRLNGYTAANDVLDVLAAKGGHLYVVPAV